MNNKIKLAGGAILSAGAIAIGLRRRKVRKLNISYNTVPLNFTAIVARRKKFLDKSLEKERININYLPFTVGREMTEAMAHNKLHISSMMGITSVITSHSLGSDIRILAATSRSPKSFAIVTPTGYNMGVSALAGKKVALPIGTEAHYLLARALNEVNLSLQDVHIENMLIQEAAAALEQGDVQAAVLADPLLAKMIARGKIRILRDGEGLMQGLTVVAATYKFIKKNRRLLEKYLDAHRISQNYIFSNFPGVIELVAKETSIEPGIVQDIISKYNFSPQIDQSSMALIQDKIDFLSNQEIIDKAFLARDLLDEKLAERIITLPNFF